MNIEMKDAAITPAGPQDDFPGSFQVILSAPTKDRDGETLLPGDWKLPLPAHITFDLDHAMSVAGTVGSGVPTLDPVSGNLVVDGTYSSLPRAQEVRTLVAEGHIRTTSVAFMSEPAQAKDGKPRKVRELLNGAFVAVPSNREALVLASKMFAAKTGARNSKTDAGMIQQIHDHTAALGADCPTPAKGRRRKDMMMPAGGDDMATLCQAADAALDQALLLFAAVDAASLPPEVQQGIALVTAAEESIDSMLEAMNIPDPDDPADQSAGAPAKSAPGTPGADRAGAPADPAEMQSRAAQFRALNHYIDAV